MISVETSKYLVLVTKQTQQLLCFIRATIADLRSNEMLIAPPTGSQCCLCTVTERAVNHSRVAISAFSRDVLAATEQGVH
jgi:hypothetical protein